MAGLWASFNIAHFQCVWAGVQPESVWPYHNPTGSARATKGARKLNSRQLAEMAAYRVGIQVHSMFKSLGSGWNIGVPDLEDDSGPTLKYAPVKEVRSRLIGEEWLVEKHRV